METTTEYLAQAKEEMEKRNNMINDFWADLLGGYSYMHPEIGDTIFVDDVEYKLINIEFNSLTDTLQDAVVELENRYDHSIKETAMTELNDIRYSEYHDGYIDESTCNYDYILYDDGSQEQVVLSDWISDDYYYNYSMVMEGYIHSYDAVDVYDESGERSDVATHEYMRYCDTYQYCEDIEGYSEDWVYCEDGDNYYTYGYAEDYLYQDEDGDWYEERSNAGSELISEYHDWNGDYCPRYANDDDEKNFHTLTMGIELETDNSCDDEELAETSLNILNDYEYDDFFHCERDCTVDVEFISQPCSMKYWNSKQDDLHKALENMKKYATSHDSGHCGLHVHVNENFFSEEGYKRLKIILEYFKDEIFAFSRRQAMDYEYANFYASDNSYGKTNSKENLKVGNIAKYVRGHDGWYNEHSGKTFEFRMFRGSLRFETVMATLEFVNNICHIANDLSINDISWGDIINYGNEKYCSDYSAYRGIESYALLKIEPLINEAKTFERYMNSMVENNVLFARAGGACFYTVDKNYDGRFVLRTANGWMDDRLDYKDIDENNVDSLLGSFLHIATDDEIRSGMERNPNWNR